MEVVRNFRIIDENKSSKRCFKNWALRDKTDQSSWVIGGRTFHAERGK
jgi:hypothetical protein